MSAPTSVFLPSRADNCCTPDAPNQRQRGSASACQCQAYNPNKRCPGTIVRRISHLTDEIADRGTAKHLTRCQQRDGRDGARAMHARGGKAQFRANAIRCDRFEPWVGWLDPSCQKASTSLPMLERVPCLAPPNDGELKACHPLGSWAREDLATVGLAASSTGARKALFSPS